MIRVMKKDGRKKAKFYFSSGANSPIEAILTAPNFAGMDIFHYEDRVEVIDGNVRYIAEKV